MALNAYRHVLRSARLAFEGSSALVLSNSHRGCTLLISASRRDSAQIVNTQAGDAHMFAAAQLQARTQFQNNKGLEANSDLAQKAIVHAEEVAAILKQNIVQGVKGPGEERYKLKIRKDTERGDNDSIKMPNGKNVVIDGKTCCSS